MANLAIAAILSYMPSRNVSLTQELDQFVATRVASGRYENASEVVRASLRALEREEEDRELKTTALKAALDAAMRGGIYKGDPFADLRKKHGLPARKSAR